jgi:hypothetical protein
MPSRACVLALFLAALPAALVACTRPDSAPPAVSITAEAAGRAPSAEPAAAPSSDPGPGAVAGSAKAKCEALRARVHDEFATAYAKAPRTCAKDADCAEVPIDCIRCWRGAIEKSQVASYAQTIAPIEAACASPEMDECQRVAPAPIPSCPAYRTVCQAGRCEAAVRTK